MGETYETSIEIRFQEVDAAGVVFFANLLDYSHVAYEKFLKHIGFQWQEWFTNPEWMIPIRKAHAEYFSPMYAGESYRMQITVTRLGETSFTLNYDFCRKDGKQCSNAQTVHTFVNKAAGKKMPMPENVRNRLQPYLAK